MCDDDLVSPTKKDGLEKKQRPDGESDAESITWLLKSQQHPSIGTVQY